MQFTLFGYTVKVFKSTDIDEKTLEIIRENGKAAAVRYYRNEMSLRGEVVSLKEGITKVNSLATRLGLDGYWS